jgi:hypothetical protein
VELTAGVTAVSASLAALSSGSVALRSLANAAFVAAGGLVQLIALSDLAPRSLSAMQSVPMPLSASSTLFSIDGDVVGDSAAAPSGVSPGGFVESKFPDSEDEASVKDVEDSNVDADDDGDIDADELAVAGVSESKLDASDTLDADVEAAPLLPPPLPAAIALTPNHEHGYWNGAATKSIFGVVCLSVTDVAALVARATEVALSVISDGIEPAAAAGDGAADGADGATDGAADTTAVPATRPPGAASALQWAAVLGLSAVCGRYDPRLQRVYTPLLAAVHADNAAVVTALLAARVAVDGTGYVDDAAAGVHWSTPLTVALSRGLERTVAQLIEAGADVDARHPVSGANALKFALTSPNLRKVAALTSFHESHAAPVGGEASSALPLRCVHERASVRVGGDDEKAPEGTTRPPLLSTLSSTFGASRGPASLKPIVVRNSAKVTQRMVARLLAAGADPNLSDAQCRFPLHWVCGGAAVDTSLRSVRVRLAAVLDGGVAAALVTLLVAHGAKLDVASTEGHTPLHASVMHPGQPAAAMALLRAGANPNLQDARGNLALHFACLGKGFMRHVVVGPYSHLQGAM